MTTTNPDRDVVCRRLDRWAWEATIKISGHAWIVAHAPTRRRAIRRLRKKLTRR